VSRRTERIGNLIRAVVAEAIQSRLSDPRIEPLTSVTRVEVSADLAVARVYVSIMAPESRQQLCLAGLGHAAGRLRTMVAEELTLRQAPRLEFVLDDSIQRSFRTVQAIDAAMAELGERPPWEQEEEDEGAAAEDVDDQAGGEPQSPGGLAADAPRPRDDGPTAGREEDG
jgi:ribosome-binding factor A